MFIKKYRLFAQLGFHRFLYGDHGFRLEIFRFFNELRFGLWSVYSDDEFNGGFKVSFPLPPRTYKSRRAFRVRMTDYFDLSYQGRYTTLVGTQLRANELLDDTFIRYNPQYFKSNLGRAEGR